MAQHYVHQPPQQKRGFPVWAAILIGAVLVVVLCCGIITVGAVLGGDDDKPRRPPATVAAEDETGLETEPEPDPEPDPEPEPGSSRTNPVPAGDTFTVRDWDVEMAPSESGSQWRDVRDGGGDRYLPWVGQ
jgi:hypothetical protein